ncbi:MAG: hypothetical protein UX31_C0017G0001 [Candidatus Nomurabacteria bacterium GW2011_GWA1_46_11]|nr:MAG: hypothetical protein UX29_C0005G0001 [Parcubacteria group bacterium GW2011_GWA2_46_10]KKU21417.1 MAG: hypothetical protein UX31_C0017G0001 [Candidatus Nomurabacteria bacterium GW2011_GWA1_46_11]
MTLTDTLLKSKILGGWIDEAVWDLIKAIMRRLGGRMHETEEKGPGEPQVRVVQQAERPAKVDYTGKLALVIPKMIGQPDGKDAIKKINEFVTEAILGTDPLPGGEDQLSQAMSAFIPPREDHPKEWDYEQGATNLILIFSSFEKDEVYTIFRMITKDHIAENIVQFIKILNRLGVEWWPIIDAWADKQGAAIEAGTELDRVKRIIRGKPLPDNTRKPLVEEVRRLLDEGLTTAEIADHFRARGYDQLLLSRRSSR